MYPVRLIQRLYAGDAIKEKGDEHHLLLACERLKSFLHLSLVVCASVGRSIHAREQNRCSSPLCPLDDLREVRLHRLDRLTAQHIVGSEFENQKANISIQRPVNSSETSGAGVA